MEETATTRPQRVTAHEDVGSRVGTTRADWKRRWWRGKAHLDRGCCLGGLEQGLRNPGPT